MRILASIVVMGCLCLGGGGCALFKKSNSAGSTGTSTPAAGGTSPAKFPGANDPILNSSGGAAKATPTPVQPTGGEAMLAGRVVDGYSRPPTNTFIRLVNLDEKETQPTEIAVTPDGYFTVQNLKRGGHYKLLARGKNGERMLAGVVYTSAPNVTMFIQLKEELAGGNTPDVPGSPAYQGKPPESAKPSGLTKPLGETELPAVSVPSPSSNGSGQQGAVGSKATDWPPVLNIQPPKKATPPPLQIPAETTPSAPPIAPPAAPPIASAPAYDVKPTPAINFGPNATPANPSPASTGPARVPSCVRVGRQLVNFALNDVHGEPWEFRTSRKGKLILLDFWWTECAPCLGSIPDIRKLHQKYAGMGLEIIGIANEVGGTFQEQALRVQSACNRHQIPYRQLIAGGPSCPVRTQLEVQAFPTLVLLDADGWILWTHIGRPDFNSLTELDRLIQRRLK